MSKRRFNPTLEEDRMPIVEKLYKAKNTGFHGSGGFEADDDERAEVRERIADANQKRLDAAAGAKPRPDDCTKCSRPMFESWLWERYSHPVCDSCRDDVDEHKLLPRTDVKTTYMLKDEDLDLREPPLRFYAKKNPHNPRYGHMKLYLKCQVVERMLEVHGSFAELEDAKARRSDIREAKAEKQFEKKIKEMRKQIRGAGVQAKPTQAHHHRFGPEEHDAGTDEYVKTCIDCDYEMRYEKM